MIVDSHCHLDRLDFDKLDLNLDQVLDKARAKKVEHFLCVKDFWYTTPFKQSSSS